MTLFTKTSMISGKDNTMDLPITVEDYENWMKSGTVIQRYFPKLTDSQREFMLSGATDQEWETLKGEDE